MKKLILLLLISVSTYGQLSPGLSSTYFESAVTAGSNRGVTSDALNTAFGLKANITSPSFITSISSPLITVSGETASTIASFDASKVLKSLPLATYPSLTELSYVKGVTSAVQTQINTKALNLLTGYVSGAGTVASTDTVLQGIQKLNGNNALKANIDSQTFTGDPKAPTPTAGDNDTSVVNSAFVTGAIATADAGNVKTSGNQNIGGTKTFLSSGNAIVITGSSASIPAADFYATLNNPNALAYSFLIDVAVGVTSPTVFAIRNGSDKFWINKSGDVTANNITLNSVLNLKSYTVATLPAGTPNAMAVVTDALAPTYNATVVGGGAIRVPVFYNGTNWTAH